MKILSQYAIVFCSALYTFAAFSAPIPFEASTTELEYQVGGQGLRHVVVHSRQEMQSFVDQVTFPEYFTFDPATGTITKVPFTIAMLEQNLVPTMNFDFDISSYMILMLGAQPQDEKGLAVRQVINDGITVQVHAVEQVYDPATCNHAGDMTFPAAVVSLPKTTLPISLVYTSETVYCGSN